MQKYNLDFETLLSLLEEVRQNGILFTNLPPGFLGQKKSCQVRIALAEGKIIRCAVEDSEGQTQILGNNRAYSALSGMRSLEWFLDPRLPDALFPASTLSAAPQTRPPGETELPPDLPRRAVPLRDISSIVPRLVFGPNPKLLHSLSRSQRRVLVLVDGTRSIEKITSILSSQDTQGVLKVLQELEARGLVTLER